MKGFDSQVNLGNNEIKTKFNGFIFLTARLLFFFFFLKMFFLNLKKRYSLEHFPPFFWTWVVGYCCVKNHPKTFFMFLFPFTALSIFAMRRALQSCKEKHYRIQTSQDLFLSLELCLFVVQHLKYNYYKFSNISPVLSWPQLIWIHFLSLKLPTWRSL